jgi:hypothetical protein
MGFRLRLPQHFSKELSTHDGMDHVTWTGRDFPTLFSSDVRKLHISHPARHDECEHAWIFHIISRPHGGSAVAYLPMGYVSATYQ